MGAVTTIYVVRFQGVEPSTSVTSPTTLTTKTNSNAAAQNRVTPSDEKSGA